MARLTISNLALERGGRPLIRGLNFSVDTGVIAVLGPNGVGKTTLLLAIAGLFPPSAGEVQLVGKSLPAAGRARARVVGLLPQEHSPAFSHLCQDVVLLGRLAKFRRFWAPGSQDRAAAAVAMASVGISELAGRRYDELSGGERRLVLLAMVICQDPEVLLLDEPTAFLDVKHSLLIMNQLRRFVGLGRVTVAVFHDVSQAVQCADWLLVLLADGRFAFGRVDEVLSPETLRESYGVDWEVGRTQTGRPFVVPLSMAGAARSVG